jgi:hypothetical protein
MENLMINELVDLAQYTAKILSHYEIWALLVLFILIKIYRSGFNPIKTYKKMKVYYKFKKILKPARSFNHKTTLLIKYGLNAPISEKETELQTFLDMKNKLGEVYPFMKVVSAEKAGDVHVQG